MSPMERFNSTFGNKPVFAMLHLKGDTEHDRLRRTLREIDILTEAGVDGVIVENYFGSADDVESVLEYLATHRSECTYGVNVLDDDVRAFELARSYGAAFIQLDSVAGHLAPDDDAAFAEWLAEQREQSSALVFGGVRFKYQPVLSGNSVETDLRLAIERCDAVVVTGVGTGIETDLSKIVDFRDVVGQSFPLITGAGVTIRNAENQLSVADGAIVGSYLKDTFTDNGDVSAEHAESLVEAVRRIRGAAPIDTVRGV
ncbi:MAG: BtpA/SgcQ family protein [Actinomycetota bacterium]